MSNDIMFLGRKGKEQSLNLSERDAKGRVSNELCLSLFLVYTSFTSCFTGCIDHI
jgi:hypothetical protein